MSVFRPFCAYRPSKENQKSIPELPYDVMSSDEAREMANGNPLSFLHVDKAEIDLPKGVDLYSDEVYKKAAENLNNLIDSGALIHDETPCFYIYKQIMNGKSQTGIVGTAAIDDYINNVIKKHENTLAKKEQDRIRHVDTCNANTGPIFLTYRKSDEIDEAVAKWTAEHSPVYDFEKNDVQNTVWVIDDSEICAKIQGAFKNSSAFYIADGHHRCASAVKVGQKRREEKKDYTGDEEFNYFLAVAFPDEELYIMDYNRVVRDLNGMTVEEFFDKVKKDFTITEESGTYAPSSPHTVGMFVEGKWYSLKANDSIVDNSDPVKKLDVSILQNYLLDPILNIQDPKNDDRIDFVGGIRGLKELEKRAQSDMKIAFSMYPTTVSELMDIADAGRIMPPKSTWFEPKLLSGIFIHKLD